VISYDKTRDNKTKFTGLWKNIVTALKSKPRAVTGSTKKKNCALAVY